jgi:hypothetical protein
LIVSRLPALAEGEALEEGDVVVQPARLKPAAARVALPVMMNCRLRIVVVLLGYESCVFLADDALAYASVEGDAASVSQQFACLAAWIGVPT